MQFLEIYVIMVSQSVMLSLCTEVIQMKYENPTCDIVLLERADCLTGSANSNVNTDDTPWMDLQSL